MKALPKKLAGVGLALTVLTQPALAMSGTCSGESCYTVGSSAVDASILDATSREGATLLLTTGRVAGSYQVGALVGTSPSTGYFDTGITVTTGVYRTGGTIFANGGGQVSVTSAAGSIGLIGGGGIASGQIAGSYAAGSLIAGTGAGGGLSGASLRIGDIAAYGGTITATPAITISSVALDFPYAQITSSSIPGYSVEYLVIGTVGTISPDQVGPLILAAVPEPETYAMFLAGLGLLGFAARRRTTAA